MKTFNLNKTKQLNNGCLEWTGGKDSGGYGCSWNGERVVGAHKHAWEYYNQANVLPGFEVAHSCNNRLCVNVGHLSIKTPLENTHDKFANGTMSHLHGSKNGRAKLTESVVLEIRKLSQTVSQKDLAEKYNLPRPTVSHIVCRRTWKHI